MLVQDYAILAVMIGMGLALWGYSRIKWWRRDRYWRMIMDLRADPERKARQGEA